MSLAEKGNGGRRGGESEKNEDGMNQYLLGMEGQASGKNRFLDSVKNSAEASKQHKSAGGYIFFLCHLLNCW